MDRPNGDIELDVDDIDRYYFFPYTEYEEYDPEEPLYALVAVFEDVGDVVIYNRPGSVGTYHTTDPSETTPDIYPPTDAFKMALARILTNPGETQNITEFVGDMEPWEHHQLELIITGLNQDPELFPEELIEFINRTLNETMDIEITDGPATQTEFSKFLHRTEDFYYEMKHGQ